MISQEKNKVEYYIFDSLEDMIATADNAVPHHKAEEHVHWHDEWIGRDFAGWSDVYAAARSAWPDGLETLEKMLEEIDRCELPQPKSRRRRTRFQEDDGDELDYDRLRTGRAYWRTSRRETCRGPATITIIVDVGGNCKRASRDLLWRGAAAVALAQRLEEAGYRVELWAVARFNKSKRTSRGPSSRGPWAWSVFQAVCLKRPEDPVVPSTLIAAVSGWMYRTLFFRIMCLGHREVKGTLGQANIPQGADMELISNDPDRILIADAFIFDVAVGKIRNVLNSFSTNSNPV